MESKMNISEIVLMTPASPGSFAEDIMQGQGCVYVYTHCRNMTNVC